MAIWVPSVTNQAKETESSDARSPTRGYSFISPVEDKNEGTWRQSGDGDSLELSVIGNSSDNEAINDDVLLEDLKV